MSVVSVSTEYRLPRYVGAAFLVQFVTSLTAGLLSASVLTDGMPGVLTRIADDPARIRVVVVLELVTSLAIFVLAGLLYLMLRDTGPAIALAGLVLWCAEALLLALSMLGVWALLDRSVAGAGVGVGSISSADTAVGTFAFGLYEHTRDLDMLFFAVGALLWYSLLLRSGVVPRWLAIWGLASVSLVLVATLMLVWDRSLQPSVVLYSAYVPFELVVGLWLLIRGDSRPPAEVPVEGAALHVVEGR
jgi:hypothetical protein